MAALTSFVVARPVFDSFGRSPETFIARGSDAVDVVLFGLAIALGPPLLLAGGAAVAGLLARAVAAALAARVAAAGAAGRRARIVLQALVVAGLAGLVVWQLLRPAVDWPRPAVLALCVVGGAAVGLARLRTQAAERFLRYAAVGTIVFLVQFLVASPTGSIVTGGRNAGIDEEARAAVEAAVGEDGPPVVVLVLDGLPTAALLDGEGHIDAEAYPNLAALAGTATWYRNHTTVAQVTLEAVPAILSGTVPDESRSPVVGDYPHNLFTLLGGVYDVHAGERITGLCPSSLCPIPGGSPVRPLVKDAARIWRDTMSDREGDPELIPAAFRDRAGHFQRWLAAQDFTPGGRPDLFAYHLLLPHAAWEYLPDGTVYGASHPPANLLAGQWGEWGTAIARQRHVLQTQLVDNLVGQLMDRLRESGIFDDALVVVTADHGYAFDENDPWRGVSEDNLHEILWTPLFVKAPGQTEGEIDDRNVNTTDILPTIADELGIELPYELDGEPASEVDRDPADKWVVDWEWGELHPPDDADGDRVPIDGEEGFARVLEADWIEGDGPRAVWERTEHGDLVGQRVADLDVGAANPDAPATVENLGQWEHVDPARPPLELIATAPIPVDTPVAVAVNGVVSAVTRAGPTPYGVAVFSALLYPEPFRTGANDVAVYAVSGDPGAETLQPLPVQPRA